MGSGLLEIGIKTFLVDASLSTPTGVEMSKYMAEGGAMSKRLLLELLFGEVEGATTRCSLSV